MTASFSESALALHRQLLSAATAIADGLTPPFTPARRAELLAAMAATALMRHQLWHLAAVAAAVQPRPPLASLSTIHDTQRHLQLWSQTADLIRGLRPLRAQPLPPVAEAQLAAYERAFFALHDQLSVDDPAASYGRDDGRHADIPLPFTRFFDLALLARRLARAVGRKGYLGFLDVGCGVGLKVLQAAQVFERAEGLEYDAPRAKAAADLLRNRAAVMHGDALDYGDYGRFDVVYAYRPLADDQLMQEAERRILSQVSPGTVLIMPYGDFEARHAQYGCQRVQEAVYLAGRTPAAAQRAIRLLPHIGPGLPRRDTTDEGSVAPIRDALRRWGHLT